MPGRPAFAGPFIDQQQGFRIGCDDKGEERAIGLRFVAEERLRKQPKRGAPLLQVDGRRLRFALPRPRTFGAGVPLPTLPGLERAQGWFPA